MAFPPISLANASPMATPESNREKTYNPPMERGRKYLEQYDLPPGLSAFRDQMLFLREGFFVFLI